MKKMLLLGSVLVGMLIVAGATLVHADVNIYDFGKLRYQNLVGIQQPDTYSITIQVSIRGPIINIDKYQKRGRAMAAYDQGIVYVVSGDTVTYKLRLKNTGGDTGMNLTVVDTRTFVNASDAENTVTFINVTSEDTSTNTGTVMTYGKGKVTNFQYTMELEPSESVWIDTTTADLAISANKSKILGLRWKIDYMAPTAANWDDIYFTVKFP